MARPVHGLLVPLSLAAVCLPLLQVSECSSSRPPSPSSPADHLDDARARRHHQLLLLVDAEARTAGPPTGADNDAGAPGSSASATPARAMVGAVVASSQPRQTSDRALLVRAGTMTPPAVLLLRSKLARRFLAGAGVDEGAASATNGASASCGSNNPHIYCGPPTSRP